MKTLISLILLIAASSMAMPAQELIRFDSDPQNYNNWTYTRESVELTSANITGNKINLYKGDSGQDYTLVSPAFQRGSLRQLSISVKGRSQSYNNTNYSAYKGSPTVEILDGEGNVLKSCFHEFNDKVRERAFTVEIDLTDVVASPLRLRVACWNANIVSALSINEVVVSSAHLMGDVDGDGSVTSADVTVLYNWLLNNDDSNLVDGDVDGDGSVTSGDVTCAYNILIGAN